MRSDKAPRLSGAAMTRRVLLASGGLVLLGDSAARHGAGSSLTKPRGLQVVSSSPSVREGTGLSRSAANAQARAVAARRPKGQKAVATAGGPDTVAPANGQPLYHLTDAPKVIALTIDDGPSPTYTPQILRLLHTYGVTASFSMIGRSVAAHPGLAREVAAAGHVIVNHTWTHANLTVLAPLAVADQMNRASDTIANATGTRPAMFRAPYGAWSPTVLARCRQMRLMPLDWSVDPRDWARPGVSAIVTNIMRNTRTGSIILEHDGGGNRTQTVAALTYVLPRLLDQGYRFRTP